MVTRLSARLPATLLLFALACGERSISGSPPPNIPGKPLGMLIGTVSGDSFRATFVPAAGDVRRASAVSAAIYGGPTTANVFGTILAGYPKNVGGKHTWIFNVAMRNLLSYAIGSNYGATVPPDTGGVFLFFTQLPVVVFPNPCTGCVVNVTSQSGTRNFTNPGQPYFWYHDRPTAMQGTIGTDTTSDVQWTFQAATFTPPDTAHTFNFVLLVNAMWPPPNETAWQVRYDGTQDSVPDAHGKPLGNMDPV